MEPFPLLPVSASQLCEKKTPETRIRDLENTKVFLLKEKLVTVEVLEKQTESFGEFYDVLFEFRKSLLVTCTLGI